MTEHLDGSTLKGKKKAHFDRLADLREELLEELKVHTDSSLSMEREAGGDVADVGTDNFMRDFGLSLMSEEGKRLNLIQDAVKRIYSGKYGVCLDCTEKIPEGRLEAIPYAKLCVTCKSVREEKERNGFCEDDDELTE